MNFPTENLHRILIIDIETATQYDSYDALSEASKALWMKKMRRHVSAEDYPAFEEEFASLYHDKGAIHAEFAQVICISVGFITKEESNYSFKVKSSQENQNPTYFKTFILFSMSTIMIDLIISCAAIT